MSKGRHRFRKCEIARAAQAVRSIGLDIAEVRIDEAGRISVLPKGAEVKAAAAVTGGTGEWESVQ